MFETDASGAELRMHAGDKRLGTAPWDIEWDSPKRACAEDVERRPPGEDVAAARLHRRDRFTDVVERATGRPVIGFMSSNQQHPDRMCEVFVLDPSDLLEDDPTRARRAPDPS